MGITTIQIDTKTKKKLEKLKKHQRETYNQLISRFLSNQEGNSEKSKKTSLEESSKTMNEPLERESLIETIEVLSDPNLMKGIKEALQEKKSNKEDVSLEEFEKEMRL